MVSLDQLGVPQGSFTGPLLTPVFSDVSPAFFARHVTAPREFTVALLCLDDSVLHVPPTTANSFAMFARYLQPRGVAQSALCPYGAVIHVFIAIIGRIKEIYQVILFRRFEIRCDQFS